MATQTKSGKARGKKTGTGRKVENLESRRQRSEARIMLVNAEMLARQLYYSAGYLAARRRQFHAI